MTKVICHYCKGTGRCADMNCWCLSDICSYCNGSKAVDRKLSKEERNERISRVVTDSGTEIITFPLPTMTDEMVETMASFMAGWWGLTRDQVEIDYDCHLIDPETGEKKPWFSVRSTVKRQR